jgi:hypothetical protein
VNAVRGFEIALQSETLWTHAGLRKLPQIEAHYLAPRRANAALALLAPEPWL